MDLKKLDRRANRKGYFLSFATSTVFFIAVILVFILLKEKSSNFKIIIFIFSLFASFGSLVLFGITITFFLYSFEGITVLNKDLHLLAEIINGSSCGVIRINLIRKNGFVERKDLYFSFNNQTILIKGIDFVRSFELKEGTIFSMVNIKNDGKIIETKIEKIV